MVVAVFFLVACIGPDRYRRDVDERAARIIEEGQREYLGKTEPIIVESPAKTLRLKIIKAQGLPHASAASMGVKNLDPIAHWPDDDYLREDMATTLPLQSWTGEGVPELNLIDALRVAAANNRDFQSRKEDVFLTALDLELERDEFRNTFSGLLEGLYSHDRTARRSTDGEIEQGLEFDALVGLNRRFMNGAQLSMGLGYNLAKLLDPSQFTSRSVFGDASIVVPLMRGAGRHIVAESLTQAERDLMYAMFDFERFKRQFAVQVASNYLSVLQRADEVRNAAENYRGLIASTRRARRLLDAGELPPIQVDQSIQDELRARNRWVSARESYEQSLDSFKNLLGLPTDAQIKLVREELNKLDTYAKPILDSAGEVKQTEEKIPPADAPIVLEEPTRENAGPLELPMDTAVRLAFGNRLDLRVALGQVYDAQRDIVVAADQLRAELTLGGDASVGEGRGLGGADQPDADDLSDLSLRQGNYQALLELDLPLERTAEAIAYRNSYIGLEASVRDVQELEDEIKLDVRSQLRNLREARESLRIQAIAMDLAERRVKGANLNLQAGRIEIRDLLDAQEDLLDAQNSLTAAKVDYRVAELELQRDLGLLEVSIEGVWKEFTPEELEHHETDQQ